ncbi:hepatocyte cell adhesion molecule [Salmo salar]|uniref:Hepatocyte cell adhesion molecule n=1 Tax=Salmo salar TaxID=8030 RepID=A0ABM3ERD5_SALSA|nr:hepatocyte cell adhesion molecule-like [Salmo salar]
MDPLIVIVLVVTAATQVSATACNLSHDNGTHQCYGALGEALFIVLAADSSNEEIRLTKGDKYILDIKTGKDWEPKLQPEFKNRSELFNNGTFRLDRVLKNDSGDYKMEIFNSEGSLLRHVNMRLQIQAPVSVPVLSHLCLPHGETLVTCSSEGDGLQYSWTMSGQTLNRSVAFNAVTLKSSEMAELTCLAQNNVSRRNSTIDLPACPVVSSQFPFVAVTVALIVGTLTLLLALYVGINHLCKKRTSRYDTSVSINEDEDVVYADVKIDKQRKQRTPATDMVEYGQINMAGNPDVAGSPETQG